MRKLKVKFTKLHPEATVPKYALAGDAGIDLTAVAVKIDYDERIVTYHTGIAVEIPAGYVGLVFPRSSVYKTLLRLTNSVGVIDSGYRGEITLKYKYKDITRAYNVGERVGQLIIMPYPIVELEEVEQLSESERGTGGYGSTGK